MTADSVVYIKGRLKFGVLRPNRRQVAASHPSALIGWNIDLRPCEHLGLRQVAATREPNQESLSNDERGNAQYSETEGE